MKAARLILLGSLLFGAVVQAPLSASAQESPTPIVLPEGTFDVTATVTSKDAGNLLAFGLSSPQDVPVCPQGEASDCSPGDTETIEGLSGELEFSLSDMNCEATFSSTDGSSAQITQIDDTHWTIGWDDAGNCEFRDGDFNDLIVSVTATSDAAADLSLTKSDAAPFGPDPVSSGGTVAYLVSVSNAGPDAATQVQVEDTATGGTVERATGDGWTCSIDVESNTATCDLGPSLSSGGTAADLIVEVRAPTTTGDATISDTATVSAQEPDPSAGNNSANAMTTVQGTANAASRDHAQAFYDGTREVTLATTRDTPGGFYSRLVIPPGLQPGVVTIDEFPASGPVPGVPNPATFCGGRACEFQIQVTVLPEGQTSATNPIQVFWFYVNGIGGNLLYVKGDGESVASLVKDCVTPGTANPPKCRSSIIRLPNRDRQYLMLWRDGGDPIGGKRR